MRSIEPVSQDVEVASTKENLGRIKEVICPSELWMLNIKM
jgi:hypothetical protein